MWKNLGGRLVAATILLFAALSVEPLGAFAQTKSQNDLDLTTAYNDAIYDASVYKFSNLRPLKRLDFNPQTHTARVVTLTSFAYTLGVTKPLSVDVWVTAVPEVWGIRIRDPARVRRDGGRDYPIRNVL